MNTFFSSARPGTEVTINNVTFESPVLYFRDDFFQLWFTADSDKIKKLMPSDKLHPVTLIGKKALIGFAAFNYLETTIGAYGEVAVVIPTVYGKKPMPTIPALKESNYKGFGLLVMHLPVTSLIARDGGRGGWGYTKFIANMNFTNTPEFVECYLAEENKHILTLRVAKRGIIKNEKKPLITYSVKDGKLIKTIIPQKGVLKLSMITKGSFLKLGDHPVSESIRELNLSDKPFQSRYYLEHSAILPFGEAIEEGVRPLDGYKGKDSDVKQTVVYI